MENPAYQFFRTPRKPRKGRSGLHGRKKTWRRQIWIGISFWRKWGKCQRAVIKFRNSFCASILAEPYILYRTQNIFLILFFPTCPCANPPDSTALAIPLAHSSARPAVRSSPVRRQLSQGQSPSVDSREVTLQAGKWWKLEGWITVGRVCDICTVYAQLVKGLFLPNLPLFRAMQSQALASAMGPLFCEFESSASLEVSSADPVRVFESLGIHIQKFSFKSDFSTIINCKKLRVECESFEHESTLDPSLVWAGRARFYHNRSEKVTRAVVPRKSIWFFCTSPPASCTATTPLAPPPPRPPPAPGAWRTKS